MRTSRGSLLAAILILVAGCSDRGSTGISSVATPPTPSASAIITESPSLRFRDASADSGLNFVQVSGNDSQKWFPSNLGTGVSLLDYDGDGRLDLYFACGRTWPLDKPDKSPGNRLFRNLGDLKFEDVTEKANAGFHGFLPHSAAVGDINNDGHPDLYLTTYGGNRLLMNNGDATFRDASTKSGVNLGPWSTGAAFLDYDGDGKLDLYVSCYGVWTEDGPHEYCGDPARNLRVYCSPFSMRPQRHYLFRGHGDGTFEETTEKAGILRHDGRGLGVLAADINGDSRTDLYVANDGCPNFLFLNRGDGTFEDMTTASGAAVDSSGAVQGSMGVDAQDVDGDGRPELFVTNFRGQSNTLYQNLDGRNFQDVTARAGLVKDSLAYVGWGCALADFDNDGLPDLFVVNGEVDDNLHDMGQKIDYDEPTVVWRNQGQGKFRRVRDHGPFFAQNHPGRGSAFGDLDDDGDLDVIVVRMDQKPALLVNETPQGHWIRFALQGKTANRDAIGASVQVAAGGRTFSALLKGGDSYLSINDRRLLIGLGPLERIDRAEITWPGGRKTLLESPAINQTHRVVEPGP